MKDDPLKSDDSVALFLEFLAMDIDSITETITAGEPGYAERAHRLVEGVAFDPEPSLGEEDLHSDIGVMRACITWRTATNSRCLPTTEAFSGTASFTETPKPGQFRGRHSARAGS